MIDYSLLPFGKGESLGDRRRQTSAAKRRARELCVSVRWAYARGRCENPACGRACRRPRDAGWIGLGDVGHVHEPRPRSLGADPADVKACVLTCATCHDRTHRKRRPWLEVEVLDERLGTLGPMVWREAVERKGLGWLG